MSILVSAPIRTGKTLLTIKLIFEYLNKGRMVYTNIIGIKIDGVISVSSSPNQPFDWRDLPNGSVLVWDEAHEHPAFSEKDLLKNYKINEEPFDNLLQKLNSDSKLSTTERKENIQKIEKLKKDALERRKQEIRDQGEALLMHGHFGIEIIFITQRPAKLNADVLSSVTTHYVLRRKFGFDACIIWEFGEAMTSWSRTTASYALNKTVWKFPKHLYKFYVSSENHQVKKTFPLKYLAFACVPLLLFGYGYKNAKETGFMGLFKKEQVQVTQQASPVHQNSAQGTIICTYDNINTPECQALQKRTNEQLNKEVKANTVQYNLNDPYMSLTPARIDLELDPSQLPRLSGCVKYKGRYYGIDQQGNKMQNVKQDACKRWIEDGLRPFNYFPENTYSRKQNKESSLEIVTNDQENRAKNYAQQAISTPEY